MSALVNEENIDKKVEIQNTHVIANTPNECLNTTQKTFGCDENNNFEGDAHLFQRGTTNTGLNENISSILQEESSIFPNKNTAAVTSCASPIPINSKKGIVHPRDRNLFFDRCMGGSYPTSIPHPVLTPVERYVKNSEYLVSNRLPPGSPAAAFPYQTTPHLPGGSYSIPHNPYPVSENEGGIANTFAVSSVYLLLTYRYSSIISVISKSKK